MNKKASIMDVMIWMVVAFITLLFFATWIYAHNELTAVLTNPANANEDAGFNMTSAAEDTFGQANDAMGGLRFMGFGIIFAMAVSILISNFLIKAHPAFFMLYVLVVVAAVIVAVPISNAYEELMQDATLGSTISSFTAGSNVMLHLPLWVTVVGLFGAIFLFIGIIRDRDTGEGII